MSEIPMIENPFPYEDEKENSNDEWIDNIIQEKLDNEIREKELIENAT